MRFTQAMAAAAALLTAATLGAQPAPAPPPPRPPAAPAPAHPPAESDPDAPKFDPAAVERGKALQVAQCGFCHGSNARGGQQGPDLTRSDLVQSDEDGKQLGAFLKVGRPEKGMPKSDLPESDVVDLATFLHASIAQVSNRGKYQILNILVGDPKKGAALLRGSGEVQLLPFRDGETFMAWPPGTGIPWCCRAASSCRGAAGGAGRRSPASPTCRPTWSRRRSRPRSPPPPGVLHRSLDAPHRLRRDGLRCRNEAAAHVAPS